MRKKISRSKRLNELFSIYERFSEAFFKDWVDCIKNYKPSRRKPPDSFESYEISKDELSKEFKFKKIFYSQIKK